MTTGAVDGDQQITYTYTALGQPEKVTTYSEIDTTVSSEVQNAYNGLSMLTAQYQEHAGTVNTSTSPKVQYAYDSTTSSSVLTKAMRPRNMTYPNGRILRYEYNSGTDDSIGRISYLADDSSGSVGTHLEEYTYLGRGTVVQRGHPQTTVDMTYIKQSGEVVGDAGDQYTGLDRFGRIVDQRWRKTSDGSHIDRFQYGYDRNSNRTYADNTVTTTKDQFYSYDVLNRLTAMTRGDLNGTFSGISGTPANEENYTLSTLGNWNGFVTKTSGTTNLDQTRSHNTANELTGFTTTTGTAWATPAHDLAGNMTTIPLPGTIDPSVTATYDAWNRLIKTTGSSNAGMLFSYDGLGRRISKASWNGSLISPPRHYYLSRQQVIEERSGTDSHPEVQYVWSLRYVDELVLSDRDTGSGDWPIRWYTSDDANFNVTCAVGPTGSAVARYVYSPYGVRSILPPNWTGMPPRVQLDIGHQGLLHDSETGLIYNRARTYHPLMGRFVQRDPMGYVDGMGLYQYLMSRPTNLVDAAGLDSLAGETTGMAAYIAELADALEAAKAACDLPKAIAIIHKIRDIAIAGGVMVGVAEEWSRDAITDAETSIQHNQQIPLDVEQAFQAHWKTIATAAALLGQCPDRCAVWRLLLSETTAQLAIDKQVVQDAKIALSQNPTQRFWLGMQAWGEQQVKDDQMYIREIKSKMKADGCK